MLILAGFAAAFSIIFALLSFFKDSELLSGTQRASVSSSPGSPGAKASPPQIVIESAQPNDPAPSPSTQPSPAEPLRQTIVNDAVFLQAGRYRSYRFVINDNSRNARITGYVAVQTGGRHDVYLTVVDDRGFQNYSNGSDFNSVYRTKVFDYRRITINNLRPGVYHIILSNTHSRITPKQVEAKLALESD